MRLVAAMLPNRAVFIGFIRNSLSDLYLIVILDKNKVIQSRLINIFSMCNLH